MMRGKVTAVDANGVYVQTAEYGTLGPCQAVVANYAVDDMVLCVNVADEASPELVVVGQLSAAGSSVSIPDGSITSAKIANGTIVDEDVSSSAAISRSKISGLPTSSTDNTVARFDGTGGALQGSGVTIDDSNNVTMPTVTGQNAAFDIRAYEAGRNAGIILRTGSSRRWAIQKEATGESGSNAGSDFGLYRYSDADSGLGAVIFCTRSTGRVQITNVGSTAGLEFGSSGPRIMAGTGSPESVVSAPVGSLWLRTDSSTTLYVKQTGTGNTGWIAK